MTAKQKQKRLIKIAKEFNIGTSTIVNFLGKRGFEIESNPNTKIPPECYELILNEFGDQISVKEKSKVVSQKIKERRQERVSTEKKEEDTPKEEKKSPEENDDEADSVIIKDNSAKADGKKEEHPEKEKEKEDTPKSEEKKEQKDKPAPEKSEPAKDKPEEKEVPKESTPKESDPKENQDKDEGQAEEIKEDENDSVRVVRKIDLSKINGRTRPKKKTKEEREKEKEIKQQEEEATKKIAESEKKESKKEEKQESKPEDSKKETSEEKSKGEKPATKKSAPQKGKKEKPETQKEKTKETPASKESTKEEKQDKKNVPEKKTNEQEDDKIHKTKIKKLDGPKVVGKINIQEYVDKEKQIEKKRKEDKEKAKAERKKQQKEKKKRKRIRKEKVSVKDNKSRRKPSPSPSSSRKKKKSRVKPEITEHDVQKQIKNTLARMENKKQKSKSAKYRRDKREAVSKKEEEERKREEAEKNVLEVNEFASVNELASMMDIQVTNVIATCMNMGMTVSINQRLDAETMTLIADEFGYEIKFVSADDLMENEEEEVEENEEDLEHRAPIVTVMGHVDHGKTKLLDFIRHENVVAGEAGGITQHIGAYNVELDENRSITFLDTPGHEAFTAMRARGAQVTDVAIIVVAADDGVMPQTIEAINHASAAGVPIVFAINKIDKPAADTQKIKEKLANMNYLVEDWGGKYQSQDISAIKGLNIDELLEKVLLEAEILELKANPNRMAEGTVIESTLDKGRGYVTTLLIEKGTLKKGDIVIAGQHYGRIKAMFNERQKAIEETGPATPAMVLGINGASLAGDKFTVMKSESEAKQIANKRQQLAREQNLRTQKHVTLDEIGRRLALGNFQEVNVVIKGDVDGSIEALGDSLIKLSTEELQVNVIHKAVGQITETDVMLASASNAVIIGFQVRPSANARKIAEREEIEIRLYSIIYDAINDMKDAMEGMLSPEIKEKINGTAEVREVFKITNVGKIAGCKVTDGKIYRNNKVRVIRDGIVVYTGELGSLKRFKDDVKEVASGYECGLNVEKFNDIKVGDLIESFEEVEVKKKLK